VANRGDVWRGLAVMLVISAVFWSAVAFRIWDGPPNPTTLEAAPDQGTRWSDVPGLFVHNVLLLQPPPLWMKGTPRSMCPQCRTLPRKLPSLWRTQRTTYTGLLARVDVPPLSPGPRERHQRRTKCSSVQIASGDGPGSLQPPNPGSGTPSRTNQVALRPDNPGGKGLVRCNLRAEHDDTNSTRCLCPKAPVGTPTGNEAQVRVPQSGQVRRCR
jgi:hypothetical protein